MDFDDAVHNGDVSTLDLEDKDLSSLDGLILIVGKEEEVPPVEGWLHTATTARWEGWEERDGRRGMGGEGWEERDGRRGMGGEGWEERDGRRGMGGEGWEERDGRRGMGGEGWEERDGRRGMGEG